MQEQATPDGSPPLLLEGYNFLSLLGSNALVYHRMYEDSSSGSVVVAKEIRPEICSLPGFAEVFEERISRLVDMQHPNLLGLIAYGKTAEGGYFVIREHAEGVTLREWLSRGCFDAASASLVVKAVANAMEPFHEKDLVYGALRTSRVWIGDDNQVMLESFPVSALLAPDQLVRLMGLEAVSMMPPEVIAGGAGSMQGDVFSLGALHYELLTGAPPRGAIVRMPSLSGLDVRVGHAILKALSTEPAQRQTSLAAYLAPLEAMNGAGAPEPANSPLEGARMVARAPVITRIPVLIILALLFSVAATGWYIWQREQEPSPGEIAMRPKETPRAGDEGAVTREAAPADGIPPSAREANPMLIRWHGARDSGAYLELSFVAENPHEILPLLATEPAGEAEADPAPGCHFEDNEGNPLGEARVTIGDGEAPVFHLSLPPDQPLPSAVCLVFAMPSGGAPPFVSNPVALDMGVISNLRQPESETRPEPEDTPAIHRLPAVPAPDTTGGDAYIYAAHFFLGEEIGLLKLEFGNSGKQFLPSSSLAFQCAFSMDDRLDDLLPAGSGALPGHGLDVAAGGFSAEWLGLDREHLAPEKKLWMKHTFRIDVSDPEIRANAKYIVVKISPHYLTPESNYLNNTIAVPLEHPEKWHSVTQEPSDAEQAAGEEVTPTE